MGHRRSPPAVTIKKQPPCKKSPRASSPTHRFATSAALIEDNRSVCSLSALPEQKKEMPALRKGAFQFHKHLQGRKSLTSEVSNRAWGTHKQVIPAHRLREKVLKALVAHNHLQLLRGHFRQQRPHLGALQPACQLGREAHGVWLSPSSTNLCS